VLTDQQIKNLISKRIFFGHQSVGDNIVQGVRDLISADPRLKINVVTSADPQSVPGAALVESHVGINRNPQSKTDAFIEIVNRGFGAQGGIALYKYCYIDFSSSTDVLSVFENYCKGIGTLRQKYPSLTIVHCTVPLTMDEPGRNLRERIRSGLRKILGRDPNVSRNKFNQLLRNAYAGTEPIFDIAEIESTRANGSRCYFKWGRQKIYTMAPEFTTDGGHINEIGRRSAAEKLLVLLSGL